MNSTHGKNQYFDVGWKKKWDPTLTLTCFFSCSVICFAYETTIESQNALNQMHTLAKLLFLGILLNFFFSFLYFAKLFVVIFSCTVEMDLTENLMISQLIRIFLLINWCWKFTLESISLILNSWKRKKFRLNLVSFFPFSEFYDCTITF